MSPRSLSRMRRQLAVGAIAVLAALVLSGCVSTSTGTRKAPLVTGSIGAGAGGSLAAVTRLNRAYRRNPENLEIAIRYARQLRKVGSNDKALNVLVRTVRKHPKSQQAMAEYGKVLAATGKTGMALKALVHAQSLGSSDWKLFSATGVVLDKMGRHDEARKQYAAAMAIAPNKAALLNNLGLSLALSGKLKKAESVLRRAVALPDATAKVRQNLVLALGLQGRFREAEDLASRDLPAGSVKANMATLRHMVTRPAPWNRLRKTRRKKSRAARKTGRPARVVRRTGTRTPARAAKAVHRAKVPARPAKNIKVPELRRL
ncbi:MAG TPA: tetratricopeptide repeat protein [Rhodobacteraceae bacterium]|nr:tetratricopeptide repeat protein [Paracoccaceae bacterium]